MARSQLDDRQWAKIEPLLVSGRRGGRPPKDNRNFIEAVLWWRRTGAPWRDLPDTFGPWKTVFNRFDRWSKTGKWSRLFQALQTERDDEWHSIDSTINRAHQHSAGAKGGRAAGHRSFTWWSLDQGPSDRRRSRPSAHVRYHRGSTTRQSAGAGARRPRKVALRARRQGLRLRCIPSRARCAKLQRRHPPERKSCAEAALRQGAVQGALGDRVHLQLAEAGTSFRHALRKTLRNYAAVVALGCALLWLRI